MALMFFLAMTAICVPIGVWIVWDEMREDDD